MAERMTGGAALVRSLIAHGVDTVFGLPGIQLDGFFNALHDHRNQVRVVNARHEQGVAYMAFGYAMATGRVGTFAVVPGPGILNATAAMSTAYGCNAPVLAVTGQIPSAMIGRGLGMLHEIPDQLGVMERLTKHAARIEHPADAPAAAREAFRHLRTGRPRPVALEAAMDTYHAEALVEMGGTADITPGPAPDPDLIEQAAKLLGNAQQPMIFVGGGAYEASDEVRELARVLQAPVVSYQNGRGIMDDRDPLGHTHVGGSRLWAKCDVALAVGCRMQPERMYWGMDDEVKVVHIDIDPVELTRVMRPDVGIYADATLGLRALIPAVEKQSPKRASRTEELTALKAEVDGFLDEKAGPQMAWLRALRNGLPEDGLFVDEFTQVGYVARVGFPVYHPRTMVTPGYQGTLGYGYATALGVKVAHPDKAVVSINGDGGFLYTMPEIATAVHHGINLVAVVFADGAYGNVKRMQEKLYGGRVIGSEFTNPDFVKLAESFGARGLRCDTPAELTKALERSFADPAPTLIHVPVGEFPEPWEVIRPKPVRGIVAGPRM
jgi:acetolactate synthase-1/2/3 large subunit